MSSIKISQIINGNKVEIITIGVQDENHINDEIKHLIKHVHYSNYVYFTDSLKGAVISKAHGPVIIEDAYIAQ